MKIKPLFGRVLVKTIEESSKSKSGIILQSSAQEKPLLAHVVAVSDEFDDDGKKNKIYVSEGDKILFNKYSSSEFDFDGDKFLILNQEDILAKLEK